MKYAKLPADKQVGPYKWNHQAHLGSGAFGKVYLGKDSNKNDQIIAVKVMDNKQIADPFLQQALKNEVDILKMLKGDNVVGLYDFLQTKNNTYIIQMFCNQGDFRSTLTKRQRLPEEEAVKVFSDLLAGYRELVDNKLIHRDLKPENVLIHDNVYKVADYGFGKRVENYETDLLTDGCGTPLYMSPQIMINKPYTTKSDVWSMGLIYYEMLYGQTPWSCRSLDELKQNTLHQPVRFPNHVKVSKESQNFIKGCLQVDEAKRFSWKQVLEHPQFQKQPTKLSYKKEIQLDEKSKALIRTLQQCIVQNKVDVDMIFHNFDKSGDKQLDVKEFTQLILVLDKNLNPVDVEGLFKFFDSDKSGSITLQEFRELVIETIYDETPGDQFLLQKQRAERIIKNLCQVIYEKNVDVAKIFAKFDKSGDNQLDVNEFSGILKVIDETIQPQECQYVFRKFDADNNGTVSLQEFSVEINKGIEKNFSVQQKVDLQPAKVQLGGKVQQVFDALRATIQQHQIDLAMIFGHFDADKSGSLDQNEFVRLIQTINARLEPNEYQELFKAFDKDGTGTISLQEFQAAMQ